MKLRFYEFLADILDNLRTVLGRKIGVLLLDRKNAADYEQLLLANAARHHINLKLQERIKELESKVAQ